MLYSYLKFVYTVYDIVTDFFKLREQKRQETIFQTKLAEEIEEKIIAAKKSYHLSILASIQGDIELSAYYRKEAEQLEKELRSLAENFHLNVIGEAAD